MPSRSAIVYFWLQLMALMWNSSLIVFLFAQHFYLLLISKFHFIFLSFFLSKSHFDNNLEILFRFYYFKNCSHFLRLNLCCCWISVSINFNHKTTMKGAKVGYYYPLTVLKQMVVPMENLYWMFRRIFLKWDQRKCSIHCLNNLVCFFFNSNDRYHKTATN